MRSWEENASEKKSPGKGYPILSPVEVYRFTPIGHVDDGVPTRDSIARIRCLFTPRGASVIYFQPNVEIVTGRILAKERERERESVLRHRLHRNDTDNIVLVAPITQLPNRYLKRMSLSFRYFA